MQRLVSYDSSSSGSGSRVASGKSAVGKKELQPTVASHEESEVSSSLVEHEPNGLTAESPQNERNGLTAESTQDRAAILLQLGCSYQQIEHAIDLWGPTTPVEDLFDFIQANKCHGGEENSLSKNPFCQEDTQTESREACTLPRHTGNSWERKNSVVEASRHVHTPCYTKEASCSRRQHAGDSGQNEEENASTLQNLERIGFPSDLVHRASEECNSIDFDVLLEHLVETTKDFHLRNQSQSEVAGLGMDCQNKNKSATALERLLMLGYTAVTIQKASDKCNSIDFDVLLEYLIEAEDEESQKQEHFEVDSSEDDGGEDTPFKKLQKLGIRDFSLKKAMETSAWQNVEGIASVLPAAEYMNNKRGKDAKWEGRQPSVHISNLQENATCASPLKRKHNAGENFGSSRCQWGDLKWTGSMEKQWCSYVGGKKKIDSSLLSESESSESDNLELAWEDATPKLKRGNKKFEFSLHKPVIKVMQVQGKMMGFGIPNLFIGRPNPIPHLMQGPPYFYYENVANVPNNEWGTMKRHFNSLDPEFVDSKFFSATRRRRGYVHNLPVEGRRQLLCIPPMTIFEALPDTQKYWPSWDTRKQLNCIGTRKAPDSLCGLIRKMFQMSEGVDIPFSRQQEIVQVCKKWNLVWVGPGQTAPLEPFEIEMFLGFDRDHTRGCSSMTERYEALGNSFQVNTVAYHLSPLKLLYPDGITVLSLFSGIGGAEVALDKLGIPLKLVIAVEINEKLRGVLGSWWKKSGQTGELMLREDVKELTNDKLSDLIDEVGRIDLIIGGSPCNNLSGNNRVSRVGLSGIDSSLFFEFTRILTFGRQAMHERGFV